MQDSFYSGLKTQEIQIINHTIQYLNQDYFLTKTLKPAHPDFLKPIVEHPNIRNSARCLLINQNQEVCLLYSRAGDYYAIPGGGIEPGESLLQALSRETLEETGYLLKNPKSIGNIHEQRYDGINTTYFFSAKPDKILHTNYMPDEIEEDYTLLLEATRRLKEDSSSTYSREEVMSELNISEADLAATGDVVME